MEMLENEKESVAPLYDAAEVNSWDGETENAVR